MSDSTHPTAGRRTTPAIDSLLKRVRARLLREVWIFGVGRALLLIALWTLFIFLVDWALHVPAPVRLAHLAGLIGLPAYILWRDLFQRLRAIPGPDGLAVLVERAHPELHELLVSAVQLRDRDAARHEDAVDPVLVDKVIAEADALAANIDLRNLTDPRPPRRSLALGLVATFATLITLTLQQDAAAIFLARLAGGSTQWPQKTHLVLEIPLAGETHTTRDTLELSVARGSDLPIVVRSEGRVPDDVTLSFEGGRDTLLGSAGRGVFRTLLRSVQEDLAFHVAGGDDTDGTPSVRIHVLQPPDITRIAVRVQPPQYSGLSARIEFDRDVQVLANSEVTVFMLPDPLDATGLVRLLPEDRTLELVRSAFPTGPSDAAGDASPDGLSFQLTAQQSLRYRFEIQDSTGLSNPDPGLFAIQVELDHPPTVSLLAPARGEVESVVGAALLLKALASDDFGLRKVEWRAIPGSAQDPDAYPFQTLSRQEPSDASVLDPGKGARDRAYLARAIEVDQLFGEAQPAEGEVFQIEVRVRDNREPSAQESTSTAVRLRIVSPDEFLRHVQDRLARVRSKVEALSSLMAEKQSYTLDLIASLESDEPGRVDSNSIQSALGAARRVAGDAQALTREVAGITEALLWSRIDERAAPFLAELQRQSLPLADRSFHAEPWDSIIALQSGRGVGDGGLADKLVEVVSLSLQVSEAEAPAAVAGLRRASDLLDMTAQYDSLIEVSERQSSARAKAEQMLALLSEWDSYQSLLSATRDLLNGQKNLLDRTRQFYKDN